MMADHAKILRLLKTARGQLDGIVKMVEEDRYCIDISTQVMATEALLKRAKQGNPLGPPGALRQGTPPTRLSASKNRGIC